MSYFCVFNKRGWLLHEDGIRPDYLNYLISTLKLSHLSGNKKIRDQTMEYEFRGPLVYLCISRKSQLKQQIAKYDKTNTPEGNQNLKKANKGRKWEELGNQDELDFSDSPVASTPKIMEIKKKAVKRTFALFSNQIELKELEDKMLTHLIKKNVDLNTAKILVDSVVYELQDEGLSCVSEKKFKERLALVLNKLLPTINHDMMLQDIKNSKGIYSICFVGVNGVGKSTSLAKVCCWLLQNNLKIFIAACDTFRAGAIEQLKVHVERFNQSGSSVGFYEKGYSKDDASVAKSAIIQAQSESYDVILIDTAGRMHNKKNLMASLSKLIRMNNPSHIIFVGEALVGSDSLEHIREFGKAIREGNEERKIDSILLTKVDTVDDKIGQILNMTFSSRSPLLFLGTGQSNVDLTKIDATEIVAALMS